MKKIGLMILCCMMIGSTAWGKSDCEYIKVGTEKYGCDTSDYSSKEIGYNSVYQVLGTGYCYTQSNTKMSDFTNKKVACYDKSGSDDLWTREPLNLDPNSVIKDVNNLVEHAVYEIANCKGDGVAVALTTEQIQNGANAVCFNTPVKISCQRNYAYDGNKCIPFEQWVGGFDDICKESSVQHDGVADEKKLNTGNDTYVYCYTEQELQGIRDRFYYGNSCLANKHKFRLGNKYYNCTPSGWTEHTFSWCTTGNDFQKCDGIEHCVTELYDNSTQKAIKDAIGTGQSMISDTGSTYCLRNVCDKGFRKVGDKCVAESVVRDNEQRARNAQQSCVSTGGVWKVGTCMCAPDKNLERDGNTKCRCKAGYEYIDSNNKSQGCKKMSKTMMKEACDAASDASWDVSTETCVCNMGDNYVFNYAQKKCLPNDTYAACQKLVAAGDARWDDTAKVCTCTKKGFEFDRAQCVETAQATAERLTREATQTVNSVYSQLTSIHNKFRDDVSVWKNEEGKFNTARLASDSIAGVVLGTAGGLITSSVVKKNQVENGFEDIKCTIGGQNVAEWGDQFRVGIQ
ncbi:MAG: hypothetical protein E7008_02910 [Alphaproteobacteria bacterium]|nr:hypothetical protein [Alphaproteobacteria bacterium]